MTPPKKSKKKIKATFIQRRVALALSTCIGLSVLVMSIVALKGLSYLFPFVWEFIKRWIS